MLRMIAVLFGIAFIFAGVAGFLPTFTRHGMLFDTFAIDSLHNVIHLVSGVLAIMAATSYRYTRLYFQIFGILYALVAIMGFYRHGDLILMQVNTADNILHIVIAVIALYLGFATKKV